MLEVRTMKENEAGRRVPSVDGWGARVATCYKPSAASLAMQQVPFRPVDPIALVEEVTGLHLARVLVQSASGIGPGPPNGIVYVFGPVAPGAIPFPTRDEPKYVLVREALYPGPPPAEPLLDRAEGAAGEPEGTQRRIVGPWQFGAALHHGTVLLTVTANLPRDVVRRIGEGILATEAS
jgi:hypothetical protein